MTAVTRVALGDRPNTSTPLPRYFHAEFSSALSVRGRGEGERGEGFEASSSAAKSVPEIKS